MPQKKKKIPKQKYKNKRKTRTGRRQLHPVQLPFLRRAHPAGGVFINEGRHALVWAEGEEQRDEDIAEAVPPEGGRHELWF